MVTFQKDKWQPDDEICKVIKENNAKYLAFKMCKTKLLYFKTQVKTWLRRREEDMTPKMLEVWLKETKRWDNEAGNKIKMLRDWTQAAKAKSCASILKRSKKCIQKFAHTRIFSDSKILWLLRGLSNNRAVHLRSDALTLCNVLVLESLASSKCVFVNFEGLQSHTDELLHAWLGGVWEWLIVSCDSTVQATDISNTCLKISEIIKPDRLSKHVIILTVQSIQNIRDFVPIKHKFKSKQLSEELQKVALDKMIDFQGHKVTMGSVLYRHGYVKRVLGPELATDLITKKTGFKLADKLQINEHYYAPRFLEREVWLQLDVLQDPGSYPDMFAVNGIDVDDLVAIVPPGETVEYVDQENICHIDFTQGMRSRFIVLSEAHAEICFRELCKKQRGWTLHWVQFNNETLLWKQTRGHTGKLLNYIDTQRTRLDMQRIEKYMERGTCEVKEESIWDLNGRTVLVVAEPGMGKSSTTTNVAWHTKQRDSTSWVLRVNWNDHTRKLEEIKVEDFNFNSLVAFLCSASLPDSKYTDFNMSLLKQALQNSGNITVLMDGFDEITPTHAEKAAVILSKLMKTKVGKVWVTSRPVERERLEKVLSVTAFSMKKLSREFQVHTPEEQEWLPCINQLLKLINQSVNDSNFTGSPLFIKMIASAYELEKYRWIRPGFFRVPQEIDLAYLYEEFVERKLHIYLTEKGGFGVTNGSFLDNRECLKETLFEDFKKSALAATLPCPMLESLHNKKIQQDIQTFLGKVQAGNEKIGIVMNVVEGKPQFVHHSFAEYFAARWFSKNFKSNRRVLEHMLFDTSYRVTRDIFDRMMTKDCPLHCAVLNWDSESVETLLGEGCDVNALDKGGRTVTHLIATRVSKFLDIINLVFQYKVSLDNNDNILQWTPLQYAIKSENWFFVKKLLESNVDISGLDMIRHRVHDPGYIDPIIMHAAGYGHLLFLEYLCSIGVDIHQASSEDFPSPLYAAVESKDRQVVKWLIQHGADCNTRYSDGQTPLYFAVTEGSLDDVRALVEDGGASLDVCDDQGRTAIDWANDYASNPENRDIIVWKGDVERLKKIVNYLNLCGCKESSSV